MTARPHGLADRRPGLSIPLQWRGRNLTLSVSVDRAGAVREIFLTGAKIGSDEAEIIDDGCVLASHLLQHGVPVSDLDCHLGREGTDPNAPAASPLGLAVRAAAAAIEAELGAGLAAAYRSAATGADQC